AEYKFAPYGEKELASGDGTAYRFTDKAEDATTGLDYFGFRFYDPEVGRFISQDPIKAGDNWFAYCEDNPVNLVDPDGLRIDIDGTPGTSSEFSVHRDSWSTRDHSEYHSVHTSDGHHYDVKYDSQHGSYHSITSRDTWIDSNGNRNEKYDFSLRTKRGKEISGMSWDSNNPLSISARGRVPDGYYMDFNFSGGYWGVGGTFGWIIDSSGARFYGGGGFMTPGVSVSITFGSGSYRSCRGLNAAFQGAYGIAIQKGYNISQRSGFGEYGFGTPGASLTMYYVP
ncbi:RHS repeat-associated protein, partial [Hydrogenispora ethanolica]